MALCSTSRWERSEMKGNLRAPRVRFLDTARRRRVGAAGPGPGQHLPLSCCPALPSPTGCSRASSAHPAFSPSPAAPAPAARSLLRRQPPAPRPGPRRAPSALRCPPPSFPFPSTSAVLSFWTPLRSPGAVHSEQEKRGKDRSSLK